MTPFFLSVPAFCCLFWENVWEMLHFPWLFSSSRYWQGQFLQGLFSRIEQQVLLFEVSQSSVTCNNKKRAWIVPSKYYLQSFAFKKLHPDRSRTAVLNFYRKNQNFFPFSSYYFFRDLFISISGVRHFYTIIEFL